MKKFTSGVKRRVSRAAGMPFTGSGRSRKFKLGCLLVCLVTISAFVLVVACETDEEKIVRETAEACRANAEEDRNAAIIALGEGSDFKKSFDSHDDYVAAYIEAYVAANDDYQIRLEVIDAYEAAGGDFDAAEKALYLK